MTEDTNVVPLTPPVANNKNPERKRKRRTGEPSQKLDWQGALQALEPDICDLERAAEIAQIVSDSEDSENLRDFAIAQTLRLSRELREKYYELLA
jgi:hypothetical protein